ncbi:MAG: IS1634 family transposase, partial [Planctomycetes bacterium]|nr:IS1634 family transposase [Planctomycetota bacterium]
GAQLGRQGHSACRGRVQRLMRVMGIEAIYPKRRTSTPHPDHKIYPYLLRNVDINHVNQVWSCDITYIRMKRGWLYLIAVLDWYSRCVLSWELSITMEADQIINAELSVLHRLIAPGSELSILPWLKTVAAADLIDSQAETFGKDRFYRISDALLSHQDSIEEKLYDREKSLFNLTNAVYLYDLTNTYFEGICASNPKAEFCGNQKEKRTDCRQVVVSLVLDEEGFIRRHRVFNGKMSDVKSLQKMLATLKEDSKRNGFSDDEKPTLIFDRGVVSDENLKLIGPYFHYVVASRVTEEQDFADDFSGDGFTFLTDRDKSWQSQVEIKLKREGDELFLLCRSDGRYSKETAMRNKSEEKLEADLQSLTKRIDEGRIINPIKIEQTIGRYRERHSRVAGYYKIDFQRMHFAYILSSEGLKNRRLVNSLFKLKDKYEAGEIGFLPLQKKLETLTEKYPTDCTGLTIELTPSRLSWQPLDEKQAEKSAMDGNYLLKTDRTKLTGERMWRLYMMLTRVEGGFRNLKTDLGLQPNYHGREDRVDGHIFITILAYHLLHSIEYTLRQKGITTSWKTIKRVLTTHTYSTIYLPVVKGPVINLRKAGIPEGVHLEIYNNLNVDYTNLSISKIAA